MNQIIITSLEMRGQDERGQNFDWQCFRTGTFIFCTRKAGSSSGQHYHQGNSEYKNPEIMYLLTGTADIHWSPLHASDIRTIRVEAPARIEIPVMIWHELEAVTDCTFIELNSLEDVRADSVRIWRDDFLAGQRK